MITTTHSLSNTKKAFPLRHVLLVSLVSVSGAAADRPTQSLQDTPLSVSVVDGSKLEHIRGVTIQDLSTIVPSHNHGSNFTLRGLTNTSNNPTIINTNPLLPTAAFDLEKIEVLRGHQGTLFGQNAISGAVSIGSTGNVRQNPWWRDSANFISADVDFTTGVRDADSTLRFNAGTTFTHYDRGLDNRSGDEHLLHDFRVSAAYRRDFTDSTRLELGANLNYGEHGTAARGYIETGPLNDSAVDYTFDGYYTWKPDGSSLDDPGLALRTGFHIRGFNERGGDYADFNSYRISQEIIQSRTETEGYFARISIGQRDFSEMSDYDVTSISGIVGIKTELPCGADCVVGAGVEHLDYDGSMLDSRTVPTFEGAITGQVGKTHYSIGARYGVADKIPNWGSGNTVDMEGLEFGARFVSPLSERLSLGMSFESSHLHAGSSDMAQGHVSRQRAGIFGQYRPSEGMYYDAEISLNRVSIGGAGGSFHDNYSTFRFSVGFRF